jgi:hypothetical protein
VIRRILISLIPALAALTLLTGAPAQGASGLEATAAQWNSGAAKAPSAKRAFHEATDDFSLNGRADDQDEPDRIVRVASTISWPLFTAQSARWRPVQSVLRTHASCAAPPRGPPRASR